MAPNRPRKGRGSVSGSRKPETVPHPRPDLRICPGGRDYGRKTTNGRPTNNYPGGGSPRESAGGDNFWAVGWCTANPQSYLVVHQGLFVSTLTFFDRLLRSLIHSAKSRSFGMFGFDGHLVDAGVLKIYPVDHRVGIWISEGLTQADSLLFKGEFRGP